ncbi:Ephrin type-B receptor 1-like, partial [Scleropages formosus]
CPPGTYKSSQGRGLCVRCPLHSRSTTEAAITCACRNGYYRGDSDQPDAPCTSVPSSPLNVISVVNKTSVTLEWQPPRETGGREDVMYNIMCRKCHSTQRVCSPCDDNVEFVPRQLGFTETHVFISNLLAHTLYTFEIQAVNGVTSKSPYPPQHVSIDITTNQAAPSMIHTMHQVTSTMKSITLSWPQPEQPNGIILDYELRYHEKDHSESNASVVKTQTNTAYLENLRPGTVYVVQVRARTVAGFGKYSGKLFFQTLTYEDYKSEFREKLPLVIGSAVAGVVCIVSLVAICIVCSRKRVYTKEAIYTDKLQHYSTGRASPGMKIYIDPFTYEDPNEAVREFAKEIDVSSVKIEEVINAIEQDYRLPPPMECPTTLHQLMLDCWQKERSTRPRFTDIVNILDKLIRNPSSLKTLSTVPPVPSKPLLDHSVPDVNGFMSVEDWLSAIKMNQYRENFLGSSFSSLQLVAQMTSE